MAADTQPLCANWRPERPSRTCEKTGAKACGNCRLVTYCGRECQVTHWGKHRFDCKSSFLKDDWVPSCIREGREFSQVSITDLANRNSHFAGIQDLWGSMPAIDLLQLSKNEGAEYAQELGILCAASGDLRNVIKTIVSLPTTYRQPVSFTINDFNMSVVARNIILTLMAFTCTQDNLEEVAEVMIHIWYSAFLRESDIEKLRSDVLPHIRKVCNEIGHFPETAKIEKTWRYRAHSVRIVLTKGGWMRLLSHLDRNGQPTLQQAQDARRAVTMAPERKDVMERRMLGFQEALRPHRLCHQRFLEDGLVLPFGSPLKPQFNQPNPTLFCGPQHQWAIMDLEDPVDGWDLSAVLDTPTGLASSDRYGKLYSYLRNIFRLFLRRLLESPEMNFTFYNVEVAQLAQFPDIQGKKFARIETSNLADGEYIGLGQTLTVLHRFLQPREENPHATLLTLFVTALSDIMLALAPDREEELEEALRAARPYLPNPPEVIDHVSTIKWHLEANSVMGLLAMAFFQDNEALFHEYLEIVSEALIRTLDNTGLVMKQDHTIVEKWPFSLRIPYGRPGFQEEFDVLLSIGKAGSERYIEWKIGSGPA